MFLVYPRNAWEDCHARSLTLLAARPRLERIRMVLDGLLCIVTSEASGTNHGEHSLAILSSLLKQRSCGHSLPTGRRILASFHRPMPTRIHLIGLGSAR